MLLEWALRLPALHIVGYLLAFFAAFLEALPGIGLFIPGQTIVVLAGFLAHEGLIRFWPVVFLAVLGAVAGDLAGYWIGREYGHHVLHKQDILKEVNEILREHPIKTLILGRFNSITRAFAPFVAGANRIPFTRFMIANITGGILWGLGWATVGMLFGQSFELATKRLEWAAILMVAIVLGGFIMYRVWRKRVKRLRAARADTIRTLHLRRPKKKVAASEQERKRKK